MHGFNITIATDRQAVQTLKQNCSISRYNLSTLFCHTARTVADGLIKYLLKSLKKFKLMHIPGAKAETKDEDA